VGTRVSTARAANKALKGAAVPLAAVTALAVEDCADAGSLGKGFVDAAVNSIKGGHRSFETHFLLVELHKRSAERIPLSCSGYCHLRIPAHLSWLDRSTT
jgi:hypothetical protein